jgi:hypothetical protein
MELTIKELTQIDESLQSRINKFRSLVKHGHIVERKEIITIQNWLEDAKSAQEKVQEYMAGLAPKEGAEQ